MSDFKVNFSFYRFCKKWRRCDKFLFLIFLFNVTTKGSWMILFITRLFAHTAHPNKISSRLSPIMKSEIVPIFVILGCTRFLIMCQDDTPSEINMRLIRSWSYFSGSDQDQDQIEINQTKFQDRFFTLHFFVTDIDFTFGTGGTADHRTRSF